METCKGCEARDRLILAKDAVVIALERELAIERREHEATLNRALDRTHEMQDQVQEILRITEEIKARWEGLVPSQEGGENNAASS